MANEKYFIRYAKIIERVNRGDYPALNMILEYLLENDFAINKRTFNRDINAISDLFDIEIIYSRTYKGYYIQEEESDYLSRKLQETLNLFSSIKIIGKDKSIISFEKRKANGSEQMYNIINAIKNSKTLSFNHKKYHEQKTTQRKVEPYQLRESQGRWYLVAKDKKDDKIKTFGLDRMTLLHVENISFNKPQNIDFNEMYKDSFGITNTNNPKEVKIKVYGANAYFIKNYKLHESQTIIIESEESISFNLKVSITDDFIMELMKYGADIKVLSPNSLKDVLFDKYKKALARYK